jgi:TolB-like protein
VIFSFGNFTLDTGDATLLRNGTRVHVEPQVFDLLRMLVEQSGRLVTRDEILANIWQGRFVSDAALSSRIKAARAALGDDGRTQQMIATEHGRGFRFVAPVVRLDASEPTQAALPVKAAGPPVLAILPFDTFDADETTRTLADGLTEEIITGIARYRTFPVIARNSVFALRGEGRDVRETARRLGATYVVEGSLMRSGGRLRVHVQLIEGATGHHVFADRIEAADSDLFALFDDISSRVVGALQPELLEAEHQKARAIRPQNLSAWQLFVRAQAILLAPTQAANTEARDLLILAADLEPEAPRLHSGIALSHLWDIQFNWSPDPMASLAAAQAALARVGNRLHEDAWALIVAGGVKVMLRDHAGSLALLQAAVRADPFSARAHSTLALVLALDGQYAEALAEADAAERLSPADLQNVLWENARGIATFAMRDYPGTMTAGLRMAAARPDFLPAWRLAAAGAVRSGDAATAALATARVRELMPDMGAREAAARVPFRDPAFVEDYAAALIEAGVPP